MGRDLMSLDCFRESVMRSDTVLRPYGINLVDILMNSTEHTFNHIISSFVGVVSVQVIYRVSCYEFFSFLCDCVMSFEPVLSV